MSNVTIWTLDWVPEMPRGFVRDLRLRWACEEAGIPYDVKTVAFDDRATNHLDQQPYGQVPYLKDGDVEIFESGACLLHLAEKSEKLMPKDPQVRAKALQWTISALNSVEMVTVPWWYLNMKGAKENAMTGWMESRLGHLERVFSEQDWLAGTGFTVADLIMADVLRVTDVRKFGNRPKTEAYVKRVTARPAFQRAHTAQLAHFTAADSRRAR